MSAASGMPAPVLPGYTITWDPQAGQWAARSTEFETILHGKDQAELETARWQLALRLAEQPQQILRACSECGYATPPERPGRRSPERPPG